MSKWRDIQYQPGTPPYYIRGVKFTGGVADAEVTQSVAEFFEATGVIQEPSPTLKPPKPTEKPSDTIETASEDTPKKKPTPRTRKK